MARVSNVSTTVISTNTTITANNVLVHANGVTVDTSEAIGGALHVAFNWGTAPTAGKKLSVYARYSENGTDFDDSTVAATLTKIGDITLAAETTARKATLSLEGKVFAKYMRLTFATDEATNAGTVSSVIAVIRKVV